MINTSKDPNSTPRPFPPGTVITAQEHHATITTGPIRKSTRHRRPSSEASNLARPRRQEQKSRHFTQDADHWGQSPVASGLGPVLQQTSWHPQSLHRDRVANPGSPVDGVTKSRGLAGRTQRQPRISLPRVISAAGVVVLPYYRFSDGRGILVARGRFPKKQRPKQEHSRKQKQIFVAHNSGRRGQVQVSGPD